MTMHPDIPNRQRSLMASGLFTLGIFAFAWMVGTKPLWLALLPLILTLWVAYRQAERYGQARMIWQSGRLPVLLLATALMVALALGIGVGIAYRQGLGMTALPVQWSSFLITAACIGAAEEFIFRGTLFYLLRPQPAWLTILFTATAHAAYKALLFLPPGTEQAIPTGPLFVYTLLSGLVLGLLRSGVPSLAPPLLAHVAWDVVVYGDSATAPWWVW